MRLLTYFASVHLLDNATVAIVDLGWNGRLQRSLGKVLAAGAPDAPQTIIGFYLSLLTQPSASSGEFLAYYDEVMGDKEQRAMMLELFCSADHGGLRGFKVEEDGVVPVFADAIDQKVLDWGLRSFRGGVMSSVVELVSLMRWNGQTSASIAAALKEPARHAFLQFLERPSCEEAEAFGRFPFTYDQHHSQVIEFAPKFSAIKAVAMLFAGTRALGIRTIWKEGSLARSLSGNRARLANALLRFRTRVLR